MLVRLSIDIPDIECVYCSLSKPEIITYKVVDDHYTEILYCCRKCGRTWIDMYEFVYLYTKTDEEISDAGNNDQD